ncbi:MULTISPECIES: hypothetical protein [Lysinibacillus]|uniref:hypothetical protein n=1 Tax=Lysinibacillus TaxID=400634 RepID=UPI0021A46CDB|nr:hypothetical protein [Lysinibacillus capsici]MCT1540241.1 hypothetical protein [Lysinibacillus capsici]MCT1571310.1 hypothetical protein [Lysinibacillus capsici]MCT1647900.1 hypothetical protein [Lysinibacillus capsici]MCT1726442.1 hypothetical protein [Lysinibacillus capsici]MCT1783546.1 hypothetical protein [Lysinibacillus capsici]
MFESICVSSDCDLGIIAEKAIFYDKIKIIVDESLLNRLFSQVHPADFISFLEEHKENIELVYFWVLPVTRVFNYDNKKQIMFTSMDEDNVDPYLDYLWEKGGLNSPNGNFTDLSLARRLYRLMRKDVVPFETTKKYAEEMESEEQIINYLENFLMKTNPLLLKKLPKDIKLKLHVIEEDFDSKKYELEHNISEEIIDPLSFLGSYFSTFSNLEVWSKYSSDFQLSPSSSILIANRFDALYNKTISRSNNIETFNNFILKTGSVREVLNSGEKNFSEYISLYENSRKFKEFIGDLPPEANLIQEYVNAINANTWAEKLPSKTIRFGLFTGAGLFIDVVGGSGVGTLLGTSLSAVDTFLLDKLIKGWKPNHFIENDLKNFLNG